MEPKWYNHAFHWILISTFSGFAIFMASSVYVTIELASFRIQNELKNLLLEAIEEAFPKTGERRRDENYVIEIGSEERVRPENSATKEFPVLFQQVKHLFDIHSTLGGWYIFGLWCCAVMDIVNSQ
ncbi:unnamed protein product [Allacma fusca]|uniref:Uncharacterized protein n=1 Tax=Allacma fusca TaxID=39272 RepID=A0A8J2LBC9_9HEXA|nr:unnamed protein product [Allacma fusca]